MREFLFFVIGIALGGMSGVVLMCCLQINRLSGRKDVEHEKTKRTDSFPLE